MFYESHIVDIKLHIDIMSTHFYMFVYIYRIVNGQLLWIYKKKITQFSLNFEFIFCLLNSDTIQVLIFVSHTV